MGTGRTIIVGGTHNGKRIISEPLSVTEAILRFQWMRDRGYSILTMTDSTTGHDYDVDQFSPPPSWEKH
ncbi:hypothetical protein KEU06_27590 [Pseudaminobacter sp. 19-2017]|uniref:Uncharacterized protein n=1 Tax=Pseudaminobacter soli (ex Zhang et al. 2022) TaxID=2831468 RepID=A0A942E1Z4_9HYPH|nr:hypothetical protein [Pseudaminobacter soli]MBS3652359.1 hypothetical protein [Pseudaminobacter soli]